MVRGSGTAASAATEGLRRGVPAPAGCRGWPGNAPVRSRGGCPERAARRRPSRSAAEREGAGSLRAQARSPARARGRHATAPRRRKAARGVPARARVAPGPTGGREAPSPRSSSRPRACASRCGRSGHDRRGDGPAGGAAGVIPVPSGVRVWPAGVEPSVDSVGDSYDVRPYVRPARLRVARPTMRGRGLLGWAEPILIAGRTSHGGV